MNALSSGMLSLITIGAIVFGLVFIVLAAGARFVDLTDTIVESIRESTLWRSVEETLWTPPRF